MLALALAEMKLYKTRRPRRRTLPNWKAVQRAEDTGQTLKTLWHVYASSAPQPYGYPAFVREFRKWQSAAPADPAEEFAASDHYWQGKLVIRPDFLVLGDGAALRARGGCLEVRSHGITQNFNPGPHHRKPKAIIFAGWGGSLTIHAVRFCVDHHIKVLATGWLGDLLTFVSPRPAQDAALIRAQCAASPAQISRELVLQKFRHYLAMRRMPRIHFHDFQARLIRARTLDTILRIEAVGSSLAWLPWEGLQLTPRTGRGFPQWLARPFRHRSSGIGMSGARHATDAINAMLNLAYAKEAGRLGAVLAASGACLAIGYLHFAKLHRHSLVFD
jgi:hypothetical protein